VPPRLFRQLLIAAWALELLGGVLSAFTDPHLAPPLRAYLEARAQQMPSATPIVILLFLIASLWNAYELYCFKKRARLVFPALVVVGYALVAITGPRVFSGWDEACFGIAQTILGGLLVATFLAPLSARFVRPDGAA
jgi:hypothetical protein